MKKRRVRGIRYLALVTTCAALAACATTSSGNDDLFAARNENAFDPATIDAIGDKVADWQLANLDDLNYIRNFRDNFYDQRGWIQGALFPLPEQPVIQMTQFVFLRQLVQHDLSLVTELFQLLVIIRRGKPFEDPSFPLLEFQLIAGDLPGLR